jgi:sulfatase modifying factor 1
MEHRPIIAVMAALFMAVIGPVQFSLGDVYFLPGDFEQDGNVDADDLRVLALAWLSSPGDDNWNPVCDISDPNDDVINLSDFLVLARHWLDYSQIVLIGAGEFEMGDHFNEGDPIERPVHAVYVDSFYMGRYEITNQQYCDYLNSAKDANEIKVDSGTVYASGDIGNSYPYCDTYISYGYSHIDYSGGLFSVRLKDGIIDMSGHPMIPVSWYGAVAYCDYYGYRLPTEAEWEYAARGGEHNPYYRYPWGDTIDGSKANYDDSGDPYETSVYPWTTPVGYYDGGQVPAGTDMANGYGLHDMAGSVWEWCNDWYGYDYYEVSPYDNPPGPADGNARILRGGSWYNDTNDCRVAKRNSRNPGNQYYNLGFRIVLDLN